MLFCNDKEGNSQVFLIIKAIFWFSVLCYQFHFTTQFFISVAFIVGMFWICVDVLESSGLSRHSGGGAYSAEWTAWLQGKNNSSEDHVIQLLLCIMIGSSLTCYQSDKS